MIQVNRVYKRSNKIIELYERYRRVVYSVAATMSEKFNRPYTEMADEAEATLARVVADEWWRTEEDGRSRYDPTKCAPQTWIYQCVYFDLLGYCLKLGKDRKRFMSIEAVMEQRARPASWVEDLLNSLGDDGRRLVQAILEMHLTDNAYRAPVRSRKQVKEHLTLAGWDAEQIDHAWEQVTEHIPA